MADIKEIIEGCHPIHKRYARYWDFLLNSYEGGVDYTNSEIPQAVQSAQSDIIPVYSNGELISSKYLSNNLFMHPKERTEHFNDRIRQSYYYNFCQPVIDIYTEHLFKAGINEDWGNIQGLIDVVGEDMDKRGSSLLEFRKELSDTTQIYGHSFVLVDMPPSLGEVNLEQRLVNGQFPYATIIPPQKVLNWSLDRFGNPLWAVICEAAEYNLTPETYDKKNKPAIQYRLWTKTEWYLYDVDYNVVDAGKHNLGVVPLVCVMDRPSKKVKNFLGISSLSDISFIARDIYNLCSELNQILRDQTFAFLALQGDATDYQGDNSIGTRKGLIYPRETNVPQYVSPSSENAQTIMDQIDRQVHKIYQLAKLEGGSAQQKEQVTDQSGVAKAFDFQQTNSALSRKASNLNDAELKIISLFTKWEGIGAFDGSVEYPDNFSVQSVNEDIVEALQMQKLRIGKLAEIEVNKAILQKKFPRLPDDKLDELIADMEKTVKSETSELAKGLVNRLRFGNNGNTAEAGNRLNG